MAAVAAVIAGAAFAHARGHDGATPVPWHDVHDGRNHGLDPRVAAFRITKEGDREYVLVSPGPRSSTGYAVDIVRIVEQRRRILLEVRERTPALGDRVEARVTYPYRLIEIPRTRKHVAVDWLGH